MRALLVPPVLAAMLTLAGCDMTISMATGNTSARFSLQLPVCPGSRISVETLTFGRGYDWMRTASRSVEPSTAHAGCRDSCVSTSTALPVCLHPRRPAVERRNNQGARSHQGPRATVIERITASNGAIHTTDGVGPSHFRTATVRWRVERLHGRLDADLEWPNRAGGSGGDAQLRTSNGHVDVGNYAARSTPLQHSAITAEIDRSSSDVRATTNNGSIDLELLRISRLGFAPTPPTARLRSTAVQHQRHVIASTNNDSISSEFENEGAWRNQ